MLKYPKKWRTCNRSICEISDEPRTPGDQCDWAYIDDVTDKQECGYG